MESTSSVSASTSLSTTTSSRRRVRFSRNLFEISPESFPEKVEANSRWWSPTEISQFRHNAKLSSREARKKTWMTNAFERSYKRSTRIALVQEDETKLQKVLHEIMPNQELMDWSRFGHCKRGLERWSSKLHNAARSEVVTELRRTVLEMNGCDLQLIRYESERLSRVSRIFARLMGQADAEAVAIGNGTGSSEHQLQLHQVQGQQQQQQKQQQKKSGLLLVCPRPERIEAMIEADSKQTLMSLITKCS